jgi:hypothetical protein
MRSSQAGWECDACRKAGLENRRACGWLDVPSDGRVVWARGGVALMQCPKSTITGESEALVEDFLVRRKLGGFSVAELSAREAEAFVVLESALAEERRNGERRTRDAV